MEKNITTQARLKEHLFGSRFVRWWWGELAAMKPVWLRAPGMGVSEFFAIRLEDVGVHWSGRADGDSRPLALTLPAHRVLHKTLTMPLATEENLRQVLQFQLEQHTPFPPDKLYFGHSVSARDYDRGQLKVEFFATPRDAVDSARQTLEAQGYDMRAVFTETMWEQGNLVNLLPGASISAPSPFRSGGNPWLALLVGLLVLAVVAMPLVVKREAVVQMLPWVEKGKRAAETVDTLRRELDGRIVQHNYLLEQRQATPTVIQVLEELTRVLPDDTWVQSLEIRGKELIIQGETASSVRLIGLFEQSTLFKDASFRSPLTKGQTSGAERYQMTLQVRPSAPTLSSSDPTPVSGVAKTVPAALASEKKP